jgi:hypothetical protein
MTKIEGMYDYLSGLEKYNVKIPFYIKNPFGEKELESLKSLIYEAKNNRPLASEVFIGEQKEYVSDDRFDPRVMAYMSRMSLEFQCPEEIEKLMDEYVYPVYKEKIKLAHYLYLDYNIKYGEEEYFPCLPPHIDAANTLVTFNYCLDTNIDWDLYIDNVRYELKAGDAIVFSAVNQVHWRPKREWKEGDFCEILSFDYSTLDDWRFTGEKDPLDIRYYQERSDAYMESLYTIKEYTDAWDLYNSLGDELGIDDATHGKWYDGTATDNN